MQPFTFAEYFAGIGLVGLGLKPHWELRFANDIEPKKYEMFRAYFGDDEPYIVGDIYALDAADIPSTTLATASFPCIDLSLAGNQEGLNGRHSGAFWGFIRILTEMGERRPPLVMLENVLGWLSASQGRDFGESIQALTGLGYTCDAFLLNAHHFTPQSRPRLFIVGAQGQPALAKDDLLPAFQRRSSHLRTARLLEAISRCHEQRWMALDLPAPPPIQHNLADIIEQLPDDAPEWWSADRLAHIYDQLAASHREKVELLKESDQIVYATVYKRIRDKQTRAEVRNDGLAGCLRTPVGGSSKQIVFAMGKGQLKARWMTAREYARLQGVPDDFPIAVPYLQALYGFGDAVCVPAISWIAVHALNPLAERLAVPALKSV